MKLGFSNVREQWWEALRHCERKIYRKGEVKKMKIVLNELWVYGSIVVRDRCKTVEINVVCIDAVINFLFFSFFLIYS